MANEMPRLTGRVIGKTPEGRPVVLNDDGSVSTERTITISHPGINSGRYTNIPTMFGGKEFSPEVSILKIIKHKGIDPDTGISLPGFGDVRQAEIAAQKRSKELGKLLEEMMQKAGIEK